LITCRLYIYYINLSPNDFGLKFCPIGSKYTGSSMKSPKLFSWLPLYSNQTYLFAYLITFPNMRVYIPNVPKRLCQCSFNPSHIHIPDPIIRYPIFQPQIFTLNQTITLLNPSVPPKTLLPVTAHLPFPLSHFHSRPGPAMNASCFSCSPRIHLWIHV
jgi:hypothetical protein